MIFLILLKKKRFICFVAIIVDLLNGFTEIPANVNRVYTINKWDDELLSHPALVLICTNCFFLINYEFKIIINNFLF